MIIAQAQDLEQRFGGNTIFSNISFSVPDNARIGLVGPNGAGKTTLLKIMTGQQEPTSGQFTINKGLKVGYIAQEMVSMKTKQSGMKCLLFLMI